MSIVNSDTITLQEFQAAAELPSEVVLHLIHEGVLPLEVTDQTLLVNISAIDVEKVTTALLTNIGSQTTMNTLVFRMRQLIRQHLMNDL